MFGNAIMKTFSTSDSYGNVLRYKLTKSIHQTLNLQSKPYSINLPADKKTENIFSF